MRIACLQFAPQVGDIDNNLNRADAVLQRANPKNLDLLVLPELAFSGYNFKSLEHISPYLEPTTAGITSLWARTIALKYDCVVTVGYPEKIDITEKWPASPEYYSSAIVVNADGETIANYRKTFLYYSDETWALEGPDGFFDGVIPGLGNVALGICMDLNPYKFEAPWNAWEFAYHILHKQANVVILAMAWLTREDPRTYSRKPKEPDMESLSYWLARLEPVIRAEDVGEIIVVIANRCGVEDDATYAGTSCVLGIESGEVKLYGVLGRGEKELLVVDTSAPPQAKLVADTNPRVPGKSVQSQSEATIDARSSSRDKLVASIDAVLAVSNPVSPVEPHFAHSYYNSQPPKTEDVIESLRSTIPSESRSSSQASIPTLAGSPQSLDIAPVVIPRPPSTKSVTISTAQSINRTSSVKSEKLHEKDATSPPQNRRRDLENLEIIGIIDLKERQEPDSASSMTTNTPWEANPSFFRAEDLKEIVTSSSPIVPSASPLHKTKIGSIVASSSFAMNRPQSPKSRNTSRTRQPAHEQRALQTVDLINEPSIIVPLVQPPSSIETDTSSAHIAQTRVVPEPGGLVPHRDHSLSPRPKSTGW